MVDLQIELYVDTFWLGQNDGKKKQRELYKSAARKGVVASNEKGYINGLRRTDWLLFRAGKPIEILSKSEAKNYEMLPYDWGEMAIIIDMPKTSVSIGEQMFHVPSGRTGEVVGISGSSIMLESGLSDSILQFAPLNEKFELVAVKDPVESKFKKVYMVKNPSAMEFDELMRSSGNFSVRGYLAKNGDIYFWAATEAIHKEVAAAIDKDGRMIEWRRTAVIQRIRYNNRYMFTWEPDSWGRKLKANRYMKELQKHSVYKDNSHEFFPEEKKKMNPPEEGTMETRKGFADMTPGQEEMEKDDINEEFGIFTAYLSESPKSDAFEVDVAANINAMPGLESSRPKVSTSYSDVKMVLNSGPTAWLEVKMNHTDNLANPRIFYDGKKWDTTYVMKSAKKAVEIMNASKEAKEFVEAISKFSGIKNPILPTTRGMLKKPNAVPVEVMKEYFAQPGITRYITSIPNFNIGAVVRDHYLNNKAEPAFYLQAGDDFYMIDKSNPFGVPNDVPLLEGQGTFKVRIATRSKFYEIQAEIKIAKLKASKYSLRPGTKKKNPFEGLGDI